MTPLVILGIAGTLFTLAAALGAALAVLRSTSLKTSVEVQEGTIKTLQKAREVDREESARQEAACAERIAALEGRAAGLEGLVAHNIADAVARAVVAALDGRPVSARTRTSTRAKPRKAAG